MTGSAGRIEAMFLRHWYVLRGSAARVVEIMYWPSIQMVLWGFISRFFAAQEASTLSVALGTLLGAVLLWDLLFRSQLGVSVAFMEEMWARNLGHLFVSPLRLWEWCLSMILFSVFRSLLGVIPAALLAIPFYGFSIFDLGLPALVFFFNLMFMGWWLGLAVTALLVRVGPAAESLAWGLAMFLAPACAVYYPVEILPEWLQHVSRALPGSYVFEGLRLLVTQGVFDARLMWMAFGLNAAYMAGALGLMHLSVAWARREGTLLRTGE